MILSVPPWKKVQAISEHAQLPVDIHAYRSLESIKHPAIDAKVEAEQPELVCLHIVVAGGRLRTLHLFIGRAVGGVLERPDIHRAIG